MGLGLEILPALSLLLGNVVRVSAKVRHLHALAGTNVGRGVCVVNKEFCFSLLSISRGQHGDRVRLLCPVWWHTTGDEPLLVGSLGPHADPCSLGGLHCAHPSEDPTPVTGMADPTQQ